MLKDIKACLLHRNISLLFYNIKNNSVLPQTSTLILSTNAFVLAIDATI